MKKQWSITNIKEISNRLAEAAEWFHDKWGVPAEAYIESMEDGIRNPNDIPQWYVVLGEKDEFIAGIGMIENDFHKRKDLAPNACAVYVEEAYRGQGIAKMMLDHVRKEAERFGYEKLYLVTDHTEFYERCGWHFYGMIEEEDGGTCRMYEALTDTENSEFEDIKHWIEDTREEPLEEMAGFFEARLSDYEEHMAHWIPLYQRMGEEVAAIVSSLSEEESKAFKLLDLGCGTGLELDEIFKHCPEIEVTGLDMSAGMLQKLKEKHGDKSLTIIQADYFEEPLGENQYDVIISFETLHHNTQEKKQELFKKMRQALKPNGKYIEVDYVTDYGEMERYLMEECENRRKRWDIPEGQFVHFDTPLTLEHELQAMNEAGFQNVRVICVNDGTPMICADK